MSSEDRALVEEMDASAPPMDHQHIYEAAYTSMPPGEEGFDLSHEGGEHEVFEEFVHKLAGVRHIDHRNRRNQVQLRNKQWAEQYEDLVNAYLQYSEQEQEGLVAEGMIVEETEREFQVEVVDIFGRKTCTFAPLMIDIYANATLIREGYIGTSLVHPTTAISIR
ncbi:hypothetical protein GLOTRDRAFT_129239 [Gloeophyllum trabeum ATCC 11539]|uniref:Uncharacterized protein n=1 Tax=Gloeophyllum trabeum (strain ATCC 11539 / FP-39264 / Madison 617) TaxID=670483 RepID=S7Q7Q9_GLOTA|nr:uncharacterized protein GLOTRDRAFT_129239 [Gloeophyllum trabeum ATCC 11539]EPQ56036.1 hypothetical protein GLOTRDRAFT_129239 [Gloeophyllum trabeum ATCC 11539]